MKLMMFMAIRKKWISVLARIIVTGIVIPLLFFCALEFALRVAGYGYDPGFFVPAEINGKAYFINNYKFSWRFFPKSMARLSASLQVPAEKQKDAIRIFIVGESAAMGDPDPSFSFSRQLEAILASRYPDKKIEIYNTAVTAINSNVILPIVRDCSKLKPDLFIVYAGNNEVIGPFGLSGTLNRFYASRAIIKAQILLGQTRIGQLFRSIGASEDDDAGEWKGMEMFTKSQVGFANPGLQVVYDHFRENLNEILEIAGDAGAKVILSTVITNQRDCAPFLSLHRTNLSVAEQAAWNHLFQEGVVLDSTGHHVKALNSFLRAFTIDSEHAELSFRIAQDYLKLAIADSARKYFRLASDRDALRFRCDSKMNDIIRHIALSRAKNQVYFTNGVAVAETASENKIPGSNLLYEHVHLNFDGNNLLAMAVAENVEKAVLGKITDPGETLDKCAERLAYTAFDEKRIAEMNLERISQPPFTAQYTNVAETRARRENIADLNKRLDSTALQNINALYLKKTVEYPSDWFLRLNYLRFLYSIDAYAAASVQASVLYQLIPYEYLANINMGISRKMLLDFEGAEDFFAKAININPYFSEAFRNMGLLFEARGEYYRMEPWLIKGRSKPAELCDAFNRVGIKYARENNFDSAVVYFGKAVTALPWNAGAKKNLMHAVTMKANQMNPIGKEFTTLYNAGNAAFRKGDFKNAVGYYEKAIDLNPEVPKVHNNMAIALVQSGNTEGAIKEFATALKLDPGFIEVYPNLARALESAGRLREAIGVLKKALAVRADPVLYQMLSELYLKTGNKTEAQKSLELGKLITSRQRP